MNQPSIMESRRFFCGSLDASDIWLKAVEVVGVCFWGVKTVSQDAIVTIRIRFSVEDLLFKSLGGGPKVYPFTIGYPTIFKVSNYLMQVISPGRILNHQQFRMARSRDDHPVSDGYLKILGILPKLLKTNLGFELGKITWQDAVFAKLEWGIKKQKPVHMRESQLRVRANQNQGLPLIFQFRFIGWSWTCSWSENQRMIMKNITSWRCISRKKHGDFPTVILVN